jgi:hypothetical protein
MGHGGGRFTTATIPFRPVLAGGQMAVTDASRTFAPIMIGKLRYI